VGPFYTRFIKAAGPFKSFFGSFGYVLACLKIPFSKRWREKYEVNIDGEDPLQGKYLDTDFTMVGFHGHHAHSFNDGYAI